MFIKWSIGITVLKAQVAPDPHSVAMKVPKEVTFH